MQLEEFADNLRIRPEHRGLLLDRLDQAASKSGSTSRRSSQRMVYRAENVPVCISHPGGSISRCLVKARNLSAGGMSFLYGGYLHQNTECRIVLKTIDLRSVIVDANVRSCRLIQQNVHEVGVQFKEKLDPANFCGHSAKIASSDGASTASLPAMNATALLLAESSSDQQALTAALRKRGLTVLTNSSCGAAYDMLRRLNFDSVVAIHAGQSQTPAELASALRSSGHAGVLGLIADGMSLSEATRLAKTESCLCFDRAMPVDSIVDAVANAIQTRSTPTVVGEVCDSTSPVGYFLELSRTLSRQLREACAMKDPDVVRRICLQIRTTASGYGFGVVAEVARQTEQALAGSSVESPDAYRTAEFLAAMLLQLRAPTLCSRT